MSYAQALEGVGYADTRAKSVQLAYVDLAQQVFVRVESRTEVRQSLESSSFSQRAISETDIPLLHVPVDCIVAKKQYECRALFDSESARPRYVAALKQAERKLRNQYQRFEAADGEAVYAAGKAVSVALANYQKLRRVAAYLDLPTSLDLGPIEVAIAKWHASARFNVASVRGAAELIVDDITASNIVVTPPYAPDSQELTPFGRVFIKELETQLGAKLNAREPRYQLLGGYSVNAGGMDLSYELVDLRGNATVQVKQVHLAPSAYESYETEPLSVDFDQLLREGIAVSGDFAVAIATNKGMRNLAFEAGDSLELLVKLNRPGYFYVVGYSQDGDTDIQYLLPVAYGRGREQFVYYVSAEQVNRWVSLGAFEVSPPFGTERLQVFASEEMPIDSLPPHFYDADSGYYLVGEDAGDESSKDLTRGLTRVRQQSKASAESALVFSTYK